jgi:hypothetical protein
VESLDFIFAGFLVGTLFPFLYIYNYGKSVPTKSWYVFDFAYFLGVFVNLLVVATRSQGGGYV